LNEITTSNNGMWEENPRVETPLFLYQQDINNKIVDNWSGDNTREKHAWLWRVSFQNNINDKPLKFETLKGNGIMGKEKIPGVVEFLCQKESHQSVSLVLGSTGTRLTCLCFLNFLVFFLVLDFFWKGAIEH